MARDPMNPQPQEALQPLAEAMDQLDGLSRRFGQSLSQSLARGITEGRNLGDVLRGVGDQLLRLSARQAETAIAGGLNTLVQTGLSGLGGWLQPAAGAMPMAAPPAAAPPGVAGTAPPPATMISMQVHAQDAESFLRAEAQVTAALARAVARGQRGL